MEPGRRLLDQLREIGLTEYETKVYLTLLTKGPLTANELSIASGVPRTKVYETTTHLKRKGIVQLYGRPVKFAPTSIDSSFEELITSEERRVKSLKLALRSLKDIERHALGKVTAQESKFQVVYGEEIASILNKIMVSCRNYLHVITGANGLHLLKRYEKQIQEMSVNGVEIEVVIPANDTELILESAALAFPRKVGLIIEKKEIFISDDQLMLLVDEDTNAGHIIEMPALAKTVNYYIAEPLIERSIELHRYLKLIDSGMSEELVTLIKDPPLQELLSHALFMKIPEEELWAIGEHMYNQFQERISSILPSLSMELAIPVWAELISSSLEGKGTVKYDTVTKILIIEYDANYGALPPSLWLLMFRSYLKSINKDLIIIGRFQVQSQNIIQAKIPWDLLPNIAETTVSDHRNL